MRLGKDKPAAKSNGSDCFTDQMAWAMKLATVNRVEKGSVIGSRSNN
jgi:hypothetical protein